MQLSFPGVFFSKLSFSLIRRQSQNSEKLVKSRKSRKMVLWFHAFQPFQGKIREMTKSSYKCRFPILFKIVTFTTFTVHEIKGRFVLRKKDSEKLAKWQDHRSRNVFSKWFHGKKLSSDKTTVPLSFPEFSQNCHFSKNKNKFEVKV